MASPITSTTGSTLFDMMPNLGAEATEDQLAASDAAFATPEGMTFAQALFAADIQAAAQMAEGKPATFATLPQMVPAQVPQQNLAVMNLPVQTAVVLPKALTLNDMQIQNQTQNAELAKLLQGEGTRQTQNISVLPAQGAQVSGQQVQPVTLVSLLNSLKNKAVQNQELALANLVEASQQNEISPFDIPNATEMTLVVPNEFDDTQVEKWPSIDSTKTDANVLNLLAGGVGQTAVLKSQNGLTPVMVQQQPQGSKLPVAMPMINRQQTLPQLLARDKNLVATPGPQSLDALHQELAAMGFDAEVSIEEGPLQQIQHKDFEMPGLTRATDLVALKENVSPMFLKDRPKDLITAPVVLTSALPQKQNADSVLASKLNFANTIPAETNYAFATAAPKQGELVVNPTPMVQNMAAAARTPALSPFEASRKTNLFDDKAEEIDSIMADRLSPREMQSLVEANSASVVPVQSKSKGENQTAVLGSEDLLLKLKGNNASEKNLGDNKGDNKEKKEKDEMSFQVSETNGNKMWIGNAEAADNGSQVQEPSPLAAAALDRARNLAAQMHTRGGVAKIQIKDGKNGAINLEIRVEPGNKVFIDVKSRDGKLKEELVEGIEALKKGLESQKMALTEFKFSTDTSMNSNSNSGGQQQSNNKNSQENSAPQNFQFNQQSSQQGQSGSGGQHSQGGLEQMGERFLNSARARTFEKNASASSSKQTNVQRTANGSLKVSA